MSVNHKGGSLAVYQTNKWWFSNLVGYFVTIVGLAVIILLTMNRITNSGLNFALTYNRFALLSFFSAAIDFFVIILLIAKKRFTATTNWFLLFLAGAALLAITEGLQRSSVHVGAALFWQSYAYIAYALLPPIFYLFIVSYASSYKRSFALLSTILILSWGVVAFLAGGHLFFTTTSQVSHGPWGYYSAGTSGFKLMLLWLSLFYVLGTGLLLQFRRITQNRLIKKQATTFILAFLLPFIAAFVTNIILPAVKPNVVPPLATFVGAFSAMITYYAIRKYRLFDLDPQVLAQNILDTMSEAVIITRPDMSIESINPEAERLLGVAAKKISHHRLDSFFTETDWKHIQAKINETRHKDSEQPITKTRVRDSDGKFTPVQIAVTSLIDSGEKMANILVLSDITAITKSFDALQNSAEQIYKQNEELKQLQAQLIEEKAGVEHVVELRTKELTEAQERLKAADQLKTEFIILTSHNLRTPLTVAKGYAEMLTDQHVKMDHKLIIERLTSGLDRLGELVEDLLAISSIESGDQLTLDKVSFSKVIDPLIKELNDLAHTRNDKVIINQHAGDVTIKANISRLQGALRSLLNNACKFTENGTIELSTSRSDGKLIINISDTGIGIEEDELPKLFTKFHRASNVMTAEYEGEGIGLYLTKLIIEEHKGKISCVSKVKKGSTFTIELPCY